MEKKKYPWELPTKEQLEKALESYLEQKRQWEQEVVRRYGSNRVQESNMVAEDYAPYGKA
jgi:hypothetical protein